MFRNKIDDDIIFTTTLSRDESCLCVDRKGKVLSLGIDDQNIINYLKQNQDKINDAVSIAMRLSKSCNLLGAESLVEDRFKDLLNSGD